MKNKLENYPGYWLFYTHRTVAYALYEALKSCCQERKKPYAITPPQWGVLFLLYECDGQPIGVLSQRLAQDAPTITGIVKRLEQTGLVERRHDPEDRRVVRVYLTNEGRDIMHYLPDAVAAFNATMMRGFSEAEQQNFITILQQIIANLSLIGPSTGDRFGLLPDFIQLDQQENQPSE